MLVLANKEETMGSVIIYAVLILVIGLAVYGTVRRIRHGSSCCGEHDPAPKKVRVADRNKKNYPYVYELSVDGMHCANCARRVENGFNRQDGMWATADIGRKTVELICKSPADEDTCRKIISAAGYTMLRIRSIT